MGVRLSADVNFGLTLLAVNFDVSFDVIGLTLLADECTEDAPCSAQEPPKERLSLGGREKQFGCSRVERLSTSSVAHPTLQHNFQHKSTHHYYGYDTDLGIIIPVSLGTSFEPMRRMCIILCV